MVESSKKADSARQRILELFLSQVGKKVSKEQIAQVAGISEWARRVRELRDEFGYKLHSHKDLPKQLKPGEYILQDKTPNTSAKQRKIGKDQWYRILDRDGHKCLSCGRRAGDKNPIDENRTVKLVVDHVYLISIAEKNGMDPYSDENLQTLCDICNEGKWNKFSGKVGETRVNLDALIRHAPLEEQRRIYEILKKIFG